MYVFVISLYMSVILQIFLHVFISWLCLYVLVRPSVIVFFLSLFNSCVCYHVISFIWYGLFSLLFMCVVI